MRKYDVWLADLSPSFEAEIGGICPVVVVQANILNVSHNSTAICPILTQNVQKTKQMIIQLQSGDANLNRDSEILIDQLRAIDNQRFIKQIGILPYKYRTLLDENLRDVLDLTLKKKSI
jgi:mRNA interferase MazF